MASLVPMDDRAPHRNQRYVECRSVGPTFTFGDCVKIVDSIRPEGNYGPTVLLVDTPDTNSQPNTIIMGQKSTSAITPGMCTNDFPTYARVQSGAQVGEEVGPLAGSTVLARGQRGYLVMGDTSFVGANGYLMMRVRRKDAGDSSGGIGGILFEMQTDRSREIYNGQPYGRAVATILDKWGYVPHNIGDTIMAYFGGRLWLGAVKGCQGIAIWNSKEQSYIVHDCQTLAAWIRFETLMDRTPTAFNEHVYADIISVVSGAVSFSGGIDNATYPPQEYLSRSGNNNTGQGSSLWLYQGAAGWTLISHSCGPGSTPKPPEIWVQTIKPGDTMPGTCSVGQPGTGVTVQYDGHEFPRALKGAIGKALLDIDYGTVVGIPEMRYHVVESDQMSPLLEVTTSKFCPGEAVPSLTIKPMQFFPFSQYPLVAPTALERFNLATKGGYGVFAWNEYINQWIVLQTTLSQKNLLIMDGQGVCPPIKKLEASIYTCADPEDALDWADAYINPTLEGPSCNSPTLKLKASAVKVLACGDVAAPTTQSTITLAEESALVEVVQQDGCPGFISESFLVFAVCETGAAEYLTCTACPSGSGSGGG